MTVYDWINLVPHSTASSWIHPLLQAGYFFPVHLISICQHLWYFDCTCILKWFTYGVIGWWYLFSLLNAKNIMLSVLPTKYWIPHHLCFPWMHTMLIYHIQWLIYCILDCKWNCKKDVTPYMAFAIDYNAYWMWSRILTSHQFCFTQVLQLHMVILIVEPGAISDCYNVSV